jgi:hypothetical protein
VKRITGTGECGFTLTELLVSTAIMMTVTGAIFSVMNPSQGSAQVQPEIADLQQRMRIGTELLFKDLVMAGAGPYQGQSTGSLINFFAPILPRRTGKITPDPTQGPASFKTDTITLVYIPNSYSQTTLFDPMPNVSAELKVPTPNNCRVGSLCGFKEGMGIVIFDSSGNFDAFTVTEQERPVTFSTAAAVQRGLSGWVTGDGDHQLHILPRSQHEPAASLR